MAISRIKVWVANEVLTASDLNNEFNNWINNVLSALSPLTGNLNFNNFQATNMKLEVQSATQSASQQGRIYYQSTEQAIHLDNGTAILRGPLFLSPIAGRLLGVVNLTGVSGATVYRDIILGTGLTLIDQTLSASSGGSGNPIQSAVFN